MKWNVILSKITLTLTIAFFIIMTLAFLEVPVYRFLGPLNYIFGYPLYGIIFVSFFVTVIYWYKDKTKENLKYVIYVIVSGVLVVGALLFLMIMLAEALESF